MHSKAFIAVISARLAAGARSVKRAGQVTVELLLVLPLFMLLLFFIMEMGNIGYQIILAHHCAYEMARIGSLVAGPNGSGSGGGAALAQMKMDNVMGTMFKATAGNTAKGQFVTNSIPEDPQSHQPSVDWEVTLNYRVKLVFPGSSYVLSNVPGGKKERIITVTVRMPVERPYTTY